MVSNKTITMGWHSRTGRLAGPSRDQIARQGIPNGNSQRDESGRGVSLRHLEDRPVTSPTRKVECDKETAKARGMKTDLVDIIPRCHQSSQCGGKESRYIRSAWRWSKISEHGDGRRRFSASRTNQQFKLQGLSKMITRPRKQGKVRLARLERHHVGAQKLTLRFDHRSTWKRTIVRDNERDPCQGEDPPRAENCRSPESSEHSEGSQRMSLGRVVT